MTNSTQRVPTITLRSAFSAIAISLLVSACSSGGNSSGSTQLASDEQTQIPVFSDLVIKGISLIQDGSRVESLSLTTNGTTSIAISLGDLAVIDGLNISSNQLSELKFRDLFIEALPLDANVLLKETSTLNNITEFDRFANALLLMAALDDDNNIGNGVDLTHLDFSSVGGLSLNLDIPNSRFLKAPATQRLITALGGRFSVDPYLVINDYYDLNSLDFNSKQVFKVTTTNSSGKFDSSYRFTIDGNLKSIEHGELDQNDLLTPIADEEFVWDNPSQLEQLSVTSGPNSVQLTYEYDAQGRLLRTSQVNGNEQRTTVYSYDAAGLLEQIETTDINTDIAPTFVANELELLTYKDDLHAKSSITRTTNFTTAPQPIPQVETVEYFYDSAGNIIREETDYSDDASIDRIVTYIRDSIGNITEQRVEQRIGVAPTLELQSIESFTLNELGKITQYSFDRDANGFDDRRLVYSYNDDGFLSEFTTIYLDVSGSVVSSEVAYYEYSTLDDTGDIRNLISPPQVRVPVGYQP